MTVIEKMVEYQKYRGLSDYAIEKALGKSKGYWHTCKNPTAGIIQLFLEKFPDVSAEWLLRGEGEMIRGREPEHNVYDINYGNRVTGNNNITGNTAPVHYNTETDEETYNEIVSLRRENKELKEKLAEVTDRCFVLTDKLTKLI